LSAIAALSRRARSLASYLAYKSMTIADEIAARLSVHVQR